MIFKVPSNPYHSSILLYDSMIPQSYKGEMLKLSALVYTHFIFFFSILLHMCFFFF